MEGQKDRRDPTKYIKVLSIQDLEFFNQRKSVLQKAKIVLRKRPNNSEVDPRYYASQPSVPHAYKRLLNQPNLCSQHKRVFLLYAVRTYHKHADRRQVLRDVFSQSRFFIANETLVTRHIFLFARTKNSTIEESVRSESERYQDIVQEDFLESYINVSLKAIMAWKWSLDFCPNARYVLVMNDEFFVDQNKLVKHLHEDSERNFNDSRFSLCYFMPKSRPSSFARNRRLNQKYMYHGRYFPKHCHGVGYAAPIELINKLYYASVNNAPMMPTDVWIGILAEKLQLQMPDHRKYFAIRRFSKYFQNRNYLKTPTLAAICDAMGQVNKVAAIQRQLHNFVQQHWHRLTKTTMSKPVSTKASTTTVSLRSTATPKVNTTPKFSSPVNVAFAFITEFIKSNTGFVLVYFSFLHFLLYLFMKRNGYSLLKFFGKIFYEMIWKKIRN